MSVTKECKITGILLILGISIDMPEEVIFELRPEEKSKLTREYVVTVGRDGERWWENNKNKVEHHRLVRKYSLQKTVGNATCLTLEYERENGEKRELGRGQLQKALCTLLICTNMLNVAEKPLKGFMQGNDMNNFTFHI